MDEGLDTMPIGFSSLPLPVAQLSLAAVLKCGQSFRWQTYSPAQTSPSVPSHEYRLALADRVVCLRQTQDRLLYKAIYASNFGPPEQRESETQTWIKSYFDLDTDLISLYDDWSRRDKVFHGLKSRFEGIRILRQDPWENLISFICSSNNNISRISKMVNSLCTHFSPSLKIASSVDANDIPQEHHPFPPPSALADPSVSTKLRELSFGYRAEFIQKTAAMLLEEHGSDEAVMRHLHSLRSLPTAEAREELLKCMGVGRKVADCVLLMSLDKREVVPVDTHVHQIAVKYYGLSSAKGKQAMSAKLYDEVQSKLATVWGPWAGWAHTVLFTSELKAFETYGLPTPPATPPRLDSSTLLRVPAPATPTKRKRVAQTLQELPKSLPESEDLDMSSPTQGSLAERVKKRRRTPLVRATTQP